ncbi:MAG: hypothetical protein KME32_36385 [Mojavia pulchra JT2-VF2]|jgi:hypothetical protein|uniref:Uncharacterized protein n=1 Tax=Mojavia pulchra JT2-VF2 TaxID=287848 RepID=A0A951ULN5_9NOST|nr:hypothetical protein [Mojavia pulchra JT2-VF2]
MMRVANTRSRATKKRALQLLSYDAFGNPSGESNDEMTLLLRKSCKDWIEADMRFATTEAAFSIGK